MATSEGKAMTAWSGNVVVLTGASQGIGRAMALQLAEQGARLALASRGEGAELREVAAACERRGGTAVAIPTDVADERQCAALVAGAARRKRELILSGRGKLGLWLKLLAPGLIDRIARKAIRQGY